MDDVVEVRVVNYFVKVFSPFLFVAFVQEFDLLLLEVKKVFFSFHFF